MPLLKGLHELASSFWFQRYNENFCVCGTGAYLIFKIAAGVRHIQLQVECGGTQNESKSLQVHWPRCLTGLLPYWFSWNPVMMGGITWPE